MSCQGWRPLCSLVRLGISRFKKTKRREASTPPEPGENNNLSFKSGDARRKIQEARENAERYKRTETGGKRGKVAGS